MIDYDELEQLLPMYREAWQDPTRTDYDRATRRWLAWADVADRFAVRIADTTAIMTAGSPYPDRSQVALYVRTRDRFRMWWRWCEDARPPTTAGEFAAAAP